MLAGHPGVAQAVVGTYSPAAAGEGVGGQRLVGYVVWDREALLVREPDREAELVEQWRGVYDGLYSGLMSLPGAPVVLGADFGAGTAVIPGRRSRWSRCCSGGLRWWSGSLGWVRRGCWRSGWVAGCCLPSLPRIVRRIGARTFGADDRKVAGGGDVAAVGGSGAVAGGAG